ncbi:cytochrome-c oxidase, cbb3-type subunit III [Erythrobacter sp. W53]|uniref:cytochrome-c oxidase, cbb3-type subunit III n=1 Tax=Erythrobacter sp. W53 TaxID=3425947 RepID=UPI003D7687A6
MANETPGQGPGKRIDEPTGTETVGHEWDGIEELNTPLPRWWLWTFYLCIAWSVVYVIAYPAWPLVNKATAGVLEWSSRGELSKELDARALEQQGLREQLAATPVANLRDNPALFRQAVAGGNAAFKLHCLQCHGSGGAGSQTLGYPNLNDDAWLWGGDLEAIHYSIDRGIRQPDNNELRQSIMPAFEGIFDAGQLDAVAEHVLSLSGKADGNAVGAQIYADNCLACHGATGEGDRSVGAPRLNDAIWLRGQTKDAIKQQILNPRMGVMPAWGDRLDPETVKMLTAYVHSRGGGEGAEQTEPEIVAEPIMGADGEVENGEQQR